MARWIFLLVLVAPGCLYVNPEFDPHVTDGVENISSSSSSTGSDSSGGTTADSGGTSAEPASTGSAGVSATTSSTDTGMSETSVASTGIAVTPDWWDLAWKCRRKLTIAGHVDEDLTGGFPVMVQLSPGNFDSSRTAEGGVDLRFVDASGHELPREIERWDPSHTSTIWLGLPELPSSGAEVWMYWCGSATDSGLPPAAVWAGFEAVYHLADPLLTDEVTDATGQHDGSVRGLMAKDNRVASPRGHAFRFDGKSGETGDFVMLDRGAPFLTDTWDALTFEAWARQTQPGEQRIFCKSPSTDEAKHVLATGLHNDHTHPYMRVGTDPEAYVNEASPTFVVKQAEWFHVAITWSAVEQEASFFVNGAWDFSSALPGTDLRNDATVPTIGNVNGLGGEDRFWIGELDEIRLHKIRRSDRWLGHQVQSMRAPGIVTHGVDEGM